MDRDAVRVEKRVVSDVDVLASRAAVPDALAEPRAVPRPVHVELMRVDEGGSPDLGMIASVFEDEIPVSEIARARAAVAGDRMTVPVEHVPLDQRVGAVRDLDAVAFAALMPVVMDVV